MSEGNEDDNGWSGSAYLMNLMITVGIFMEDADSSQVMFVLSQAAEELKRMDGQIELKIPKFKYMSHLTEGICSMQCRLRKV